jgi:hypothetical protein
MDMSHKREVRSRPCLEYEKAPPAPTQRGPMTTLEDEYGGITTQTRSASSVDDPLDFTPGLTKEKS